MAEIGRSLSGETAALIAGIKSLHSEKGDFEGKSLSDFNLGCHAAKTAETNILKIFCLKCPIKCLPHRQSDVLLDAVILSSCLVMP
jgi:hypothetical protein